MARPREPIDLVIAKGKKHLTKAEIEERRSQEINVPYKEIKPPKYLNKKQKKKFKEIATKLLAIGIYSELDEDTLGRYLIAQDLYLHYTEEINKYLIADNLHAFVLKDIQGMQDKAFKQARQCARDLGLTISSRCRLIVPETQKEEIKVNKFKRFEKRADDELRIN